MLRCLCLNWARLQHIGSLANGTLEIRLNNDEDVVVTADGHDWLVNGGVDGRFAMSSVSALFVVGGPGDNTVDAREFTGRMTVVGADGDDLIAGGAAEFNRQLSRRACRRRN